MIKYTLVLVFSFISLSANPYKNLDDAIKLNVMVNYFVNDELKTLVPKVPIKEELQDDGATLDPVKYEYYFNYIQRLKAIHESRAEEQENIDEKFEGKIAFYNGKLKTLKRFYQKKENLEPIIANSINKAFKVVYGNPKFDALITNNKKTIGSIIADNIYDVSQFKPKKIQMVLDEKIEKSFLTKYRNIKPKIQFEYKNKTLYFKDILFTFNGKEYVANFVDKTSWNVKLNIKINDDIFRLIKIEEKK